MHGEIDAEKPIQAVEWEFFRASTPGYRSAWECMHPEYPFDPRVCL
jgi:hypothetical protein